MANLAQQTSLNITTVLQTHYIKQTLPRTVFKVMFVKDTLVLRTTCSHLRFLTIFLRNSLSFQAFTLCEIAVVDRLTSQGRFSVKYNFLSTLYNTRFVVELFCNETSVIPSLTTAFFNKQKNFAAAGWLEREIWDLFGIYFSEHGDLRRILTDYGFAGHPLRKDFPLTGFHEVVYNDVEGRIVSEPVELAQELRVFHIIN